MNGAFSRDHPTVHRFSVDSRALRGAPERFHDGVGQPVTRLGFQSLHTESCWCKATMLVLADLMVGTGISFSRFVLERRLERTRHLLENPRHDRRTITDIAYQAGFRDLSYFNRCFRRRYLATPSDIREQASSTQPG